MTIKIILSIIAGLFLLNIYIKVLLKMNWSMRYIEQLEIKIELLEKTVKILEKLDR